MYATGARGDRRSTAAASHGCEQAMSNADEVSAALLLLTARGISRRAQAAAHSTPLQRALQTTKFSFISAVLSNQQEKERI